MRDRSKAARISSSAAAARRPTPDYVAVFKRGLRHLGDGAIDRVAVRLRAVLANKSPAANIVVRSLPVITNLLVHAASRLVSGSLKVDDLVLMPGRCLDVGQPSPGAVVVRSHHLRAARMSSPLLPS